MKDHLTATESPADDDPIGARMRQRRRDTRIFALLLLATAVVMGVFFGYFRFIESHGVTVDLRLAADDAAQPGDDVLIHAEVVDAQSGKVQKISGVQLERWSGDTRVDRWPVEGSSWRVATMDDAPMRLRLVRDATGPVQSMAELMVERGAPAAAAALRGGVYAPLGAPGLRRVRQEAGCDHQIDMLVYGGAPVANIKTPALVRVRDTQGRAVADVKVKIGTDGRNTHHATTNREGMAEAALQIAELDYIEVRTTCDGGESYAGFEAQPVYDGLGVTSWSQDTDKIVAEIVDVTQHQNAHYDVRCEGVLRDRGRVPADGTLSLSKTIFGGVAEGAACRLQLHRGRMTASAPHAVRVFRWARPSLGWDWEVQEAGVGLVGLGAQARSMEADADVIAAWKHAGYGRIRVGIATMLVLSMLLWFALVVWGLRRRRFASEAEADRMVEAAPATVSIGTHPMLWSGWVAILVAYGGLYVVLWLMGL